MTADPRAFQAWFEGATSRWTGGEHDDYGESFAHFSARVSATLDRAIGVLEELDCAFEAICENCSFFQTSIEFRPTLQAQHDDAAAKGQHHRADLFNQLLTGITEGEAS